MDKVIRGSQTADWTIPAGGRIPIGSQGQYVRCLEASGPFYISINGGSDLFFASGIQWRADGLETFSEFHLINKSGAPVTVTLAWGFGEYTDGRLTATGNLTVVNAPASVLKVDDDESQVHLAAINGNIADIEALLINDRLKRSPLTTLQGATLVSVLNATTTVVTAGANVNGVIIRSINLFSGSNVTAYLQIGATKLLQTGYASGAAVNCDRENIFVPAGNQIIISGGNTSSGGNMAYEVL